MCRGPLTNIADESVPCLPCSLRSSVHSPRGQAAETGPHGSRSHQLRHHSLCQAAPCAAPGPREAAPEAGSAGETPGCPRVGRVRRVWGAAACPSAQDTPPQGPAPLPPRSGAGRRSGVSQLTFAEREAGTGSPLCDLEELTPPSSALGASVRLRFDVVCEHQVAAVTWLLPERNRALGINSLNMRITSSP